MENNVCSPSNELNYKKYKTCFSKTSLLTLIKSWNKIKKNNKISYKSSYSIDKLWQLLNQKLNIYCSLNDDVCMISNVKKILLNFDDKIKLETIEKKELKPEKPIEWYNNPHEWLSNYDINDVMHQYSNDKSYKYKFLGSFPIDFAVKDNFNKCLYSEFCNLDMKKFINKKIKYLGLITNLDRHDQPGSHWTSTFIIIDPKLKSYGSYYYDSTARKIPIYVLNFLKDIQEKLLKIYPNRKFTINYSKRQHQYSNTECGVFSIYYQLLWLINLKKNKNINFEDIILNKELNDNKMYQLRNSLFRTNDKLI